MQDFKSINLEMSTNVKNICPLIQSLLDKFKSEPDSFETQKVSLKETFLFSCFHYFETNEPLSVFSCIQITIHLIESSI